MSKNKFNFQPYKWEYEDVEDGKTAITVIRIWALNEQNQNTLVRIEDFSPYCYVELPLIVNGKNFRWSETSALRVCEALEYKLSKKYKPLIKQFTYKRRLYFCNKEKNSPEHRKATGQKYRDKTYPYILFSFPCTKAMYFFKKNLEREIDISGMGKMKFIVRELDSAATPVIKLTSIKKLPMSGWIQGIGTKVDKDSQESTCEHEYICSWKKLSANNTIKKSAIPKVCAEDAEMYSHRKNAMPDAKNAKDETFQISLVFGQNEGLSAKNKYTKYLLTLHDCDDIPGVKVIRCKHEAELYRRRSEIYQKEKPNISLGYNTAYFDYKYWIYRAINVRKNLDELAGTGFLKNRKDKVVKPPQWESKARGKNDMEYLDAHGILMMDVLPNIRNNYKLNNYKLSTVADNFGVGKKDPLTPKDIFKCYEKRTKKATALVGKYCVQDSYVTLRIFEKTHMWIGLSEEATTNKIPIIDLYTKGQQVKMYCQFYDFCTANNIIVETNIYEAKENEHYTGATVLKAIIGKHKLIIPFDFASLYPSIIRAYNVDYDSLVRDDNIDDEDCHIHEWEEHVNCMHDPKKIEKEEKKKVREEKKAIRLAKGIKTKVELRKELEAEEKKEKEEKDRKENPAKWLEIDKKKALEMVQVDLDDAKRKEKIICGHFKYKFIKHEIGGKGILNQLEEKLMTARKTTKKLMGEKGKELKKLQMEYDEIKKKDPSDRRLKKLQTEIDDLEIEIVVLDKRQLSYKISANSMYGATGVKKGLLPFLPVAMTITFIGRCSIAKVVKLMIEKYDATVVYGDTDSCMVKFEKLGEDIVKIFEYARFVAADITKQFPAPMSLEFEDKMYKRFLLLSKKRYVTQECDITGKEYPKLNTKGIVLQRRDNCKFLRDSYKKAVDYIFEDKKLNDILDMLLDNIQNLFTRHYEYTDFVITKTVKDKEYKSKPAHAILCDRMKTRGVEMQGEMRIGYVFTTMCRDEKKFLQGNKIEEEDYFKEWREYLRIDYLYYLEKQGIVALDDLIGIAYKDENDLSGRERELLQEGFMKYNYKLRKMKYELTKRIERLNVPVIELEDD